MFQVFVDDAAFQTREFWEMILRTRTLSLVSKPGPHMLAKSISFCYILSPALIICYFPFITPPLKADIEFLLSPPLPLVLSYDQSSCLKF